jgi:tetratricopeptide (TPR) repeat protein
MEDSITYEGVLRAESLLVAGENERAQELLAALAADIEEYASRNCQATDEDQWFSFPTIFERLAYKKVEDDPRTLHDVGEPFDRVYGDLAFAQVRLGDYDAAIESLKQAVRWNPMDCAYRLDLAELFRNAGNQNEYLALTYSVFERASQAKHLVRAYLNFAGYFGETGQPRKQAACLACARRIDADDSSVRAALEQAAGTAADPDTLSDDEVASELATEGIETGANAEIAICLLMCATDAADAGDTNLATDYTIRARDLVGSDAARVLLELIRESDADAGQEGGDDAVQA